MHEEEDGLKREAARRGEGVEGVERQVRGAVEVLAQF
jgi:hypothetical protein